MNIIDYASLYAERAHTGQVRKYDGRPYIEHPRRVAAKLIELNQSWDVGCILFQDEEIAAAYLHDVVEDCGVTVQTLIADFGHRVATTVKGLTNTSKIAFPEANRSDRKRIDRERLMAEGEIVQSIKLADRIDNLRDMAGCDDSFLRVFLSESRLLLASLTKADKRLRQELSAVIDEVGSRGA